MQLSSSCMLPPCCHLAPTRTGWWWGGRRQGARLMLRRRQVELGWIWQPPPTQLRWPPSPSNYSNHLDLPNRRSPCLAAKNGWKRLNVLLCCNCLFTPVQPCKTWSFLNFQADNRASWGKHGSGSILPSFPTNGKPAQREDQPGGDEWEDSCVTQRERAWWVDCTQNLTGNCFTQSAPPRSFRKTNKCPTWWLSSWKKPELKKVNRQVLFCVSLSLIVCGVITPKATISNISCSEFHLSTAVLKVSDCNSFRNGGGMYLAFLLSKMHGGRSGMLTWRWTEGDDDGAGKGDANGDECDDDDDNDGGQRGQEDACDGDEGAICTSSSEAGDGWNIMLDPTINQNAFQMGAIAKDPGLERPWPEDMPR